MQKVKRYVDGAVLLALGILLAACSQGSQPQAQEPGVGDTISGQYIVMLEPETLSAQSGGDTELAIAQVATSLGVQSLAEFRSVDGFVATDVDEVDLKRLEADPRVRYTEPDRVVRLSATQSNPTWGLDRIDSRNLPLDRTFSYAANGSGVNAYVVDSGIKTGLAEFGSRLVGGVSAISDGRGYSDCNGHGTHVAGTLGGKTYGVAKNVKLYAVRVFGCGGTSSTSTIITGIDWVTYNHRHPAVANMSLENSSSAALDEAVQAAIRDGVTVVVAAGNASTNACNTSPARVGSALTVGASTRQDQKWAQSNYGPCLDLFAPGQDVLSVSTSGSGRTMSGTSMASPHVAGVAALALQRNPSAAPATVANIIKSAATKGKLSLASTQRSPNSLLYNPY